MISRDIRKELDKCLLDQDRSYEESIHVACYDVGSMILRSQSKSSHTTFVLISMSCLSCFSHSR